MTSGDDRHRERHPVHAASSASNGSEPTYVATFEEMRRLDELTITSGHRSGLELMESAGRGAADVARAMLSSRGHGSRGKVAVVAGPGNNGGDGYVVARHLRDDGHDVVVYLLAPIESVKGDARTNLNRWLAEGGELVAALQGLGCHGEQLREAHLVVDGIFGTGLSKAVRAPYDEAITVLNELARPTLALDIPSGVDGDTGRILGAGIRADATVAFGLAKRGHYLYPGAALTGLLHVVDIGLPEFLVSRLCPGCERIEPRVGALLPQRAPDAHKGHFGHVLVVAGGPGRTGAALLAARAAARSGAGLVTIAAPEESRRALDAKVVEVMTETLGPSLDEGAVDGIVELLDARDALVIGPGLGQSDAAASLVRALLPRLEKPAIFDADALNVLAGDPSILRAARVPLVLTPHPGEMARLCGTTTAAVQSDRMGVAESFARAHGVTLLLKGAYSLVATPEGRLHVNPTGNPGMATGGSGDVLAGIIGALLAAGLPASDAARLGVFAHGEAGDRARDEVGETALIASDLVERLPSVWMAWERPSP